MEDKCRYVFDDSTGIMYKYYYGIITLEDIFSSWDSAIKMNQIPKGTKGFILDYLKASFNIRLKEYSKIPDYYKEHIEIFGSKKIAIITQTPKDIVIPKLVETKDNGYLSKPFFTEEAAVKWILS